MTNDDDATYDVVWDEHDGGERDPHNYLSFPLNGKLVKATQDAWPWSEGGHNEGRMRIPSV